MEGRRHRGERCQRRQQTPAAKTNANAKGSGLGCRPVPLPAGPLSPTQGTTDLIQPLKGKSYIPEIRFELQMGRGGLGFGSWLSEKVSPLDLGSLRVLTLLRRSWDFAREKDFFSLSSFPISFFLAFSEMKVEITLTFEIEVQVGKSDKKNQTRKVGKNISI